MHYVFSAWDAEIARNLKRDLRGWAPFPAKTSKGLEGILETKFQSQVKGLRSSGVERHWLSFPSVSTFLGVVVTCTVARNGTVFGRTLGTGLPL